MIFCSGFMPQRVSVKIASEEIPSLILEGQYVHGSTTSSNRSFIVHMNANVEYTAGKEIQEMISRAEKHIP
jgi:hypothetical protein